MKKYLSLFSALILAFVAFAANAQSTYTNTMFAYPAAPDTCTTLESRCNFSTQHFWDNFDFHKQLVDSQDSALVTTMYDYISIMRGANLNIALSSIRLLMNKAQANQTNFMKLISAAEYLLYLNNSIEVIDDVYLTFLQSAVDASWMKKDGKTYFSEEMEKIKNTKLGAPIYNFQVTDANGNKKKFNEVPIDTAQIVFVFFTADGTGSSITRTRLSADLGVSELLKIGYAKVINVYVGDNPNAFFAEANLYPDWILLSTQEGAKLDIRMLPDFIILDNNRVVQNKNITMDQIKQAFN